MITTTTSAVTIELMRKSFASLGLPEVIVSDNATTFTSSEFAEFLKSNGVRHVRTPPYHPASNGLAERSVQTFKAGMKKLQEGSLETKISRFLFNYRLTPHSSTGVSPAELMFGRKLRSLLDCLQPHLQTKADTCRDNQTRGHDSHAKLRNFSVGDFLCKGAALATWNNHRATRIWVAPGQKVRKHADQLKLRIETDNDAIPTEDSRFWNGTRWKRDRLAN